MSNGFSFKQFTVKHDKCGMKVGTDSILLGSWVKTTRCKHVFDIGTGSGLLALMMAQRTEQACFIKAIEINHDAALQAQDNVNNSPWPRKIEVIHQSLQEFAKNKDRNDKFDLIVSNPPYFGSKSIDMSPNDVNFDVGKRVFARQDVALSLHDIFIFAENSLLDNGQIFMILPADIDTLDSTAARHGLTLCARTWVYSMPDRSPIRQLVGFSLQQPSAEVVDNSIVIRDQNNVYTEEYKDFCRDFYLNF